MPDLSSHPFQPPRDFTLPSIPNPQAELLEVTKSLHENTSVNNGFASVLYERLVTQIKDFEAELASDEEIAAYFSSFGSTHLIRIDDIGYHNPYLIIFYGSMMPDGGSVRLVQHTSQLNILFTAIKVKPEEDRPPKRFGFQHKRD